MRMVRGYQHYWLGILLCFCITRGEASDMPGIDAATHSLAVPVESALEDGLAIDWPQIERLYESQQQRYIWHQDGVLSTRGRALFRWLAAADLEGLEAKDYHLDHLLKLVSNPSRAVAVNRELLLSDGYIKLARDLRLGRHDPQSVDPYWMLPKEDFDPVAVLAEAIAENRLQQLLDSLRPVDDGYMRLKRALAKYRAIQAAGGWITVLADRTLRPGDRDPAVAMLRERLAGVSHRLEAEGSDPNRYDDALTEAVKGFQQRHGLAVDGVVGPETLRSLNDPIENRIAQIRANLERWRWLPHELESPHLMVNTAGFEISLINEGRVVFHKRTVNGRQQRQTPSFSSRVTHLVTNPLWTVPRSIAVKDMLPQLQLDSGYLASKQIRAYTRLDGQWAEVDALDIPWEKYHEGNFPFVLKQDPGRRNSLGRIKFHMPNPHQIFLHDTPARALFERPNRAYSSGCVRVEAAEQLAGLLIDHGERPQRDWLHQALHNGETLIEPLSKPMPVYLTYFTNWVDITGDIHFRPDIYQRDTALMLAMGEGVEQMTARHLGRAENPSL
ncbi:MAG: L,D-transpeptidase family protein [Candidatus Thiodiazotropha sp.]